MPTEPQGTTIFYAVDTDVQGKQIGQPKEIGTSSEPITTLLLMDFFMINNALYRKLASGFNFDSTTYWFYVVPSPDPV